MALFSVVGWCSKLGHSTSPTPPFHFLSRSPKQIALYKCSALNNHCSRHRVVLHKLWGVLLSPTTGGPQMQHARIEERKIIARKRREEIISRAESQTPVREDNSKMDLRVKICYHRVLHATYQRIPSQYVLVCISPMRKLRSSSFTCSNMDIRLRKC